jgi:hypothetical protein
MSSCPTLLLPRGTPYETQFLSETESREIVNFAVARKASGQSPLPAPFAPP